METEIEAKFCDIDPEKVRDALKAKSAKLMHEEFLMRRYTLDFPDGTLTKKGGWARVRDEGEKITLCYKQLNDRTLHGTKEISVNISDFDLATQLLKELGLEIKSYQETKREKWLLNDCEVTIDTWPWIPSFVEIEGPSEGLVRKTASDLGFDWRYASHGSVEIVYQKHYDFTEEEIDNWPEIKFCPVPKDLELKRKVTYKS